MTRHARTEFGSVCRAGRFVPAVEYIQANRVRTLLMEEMDRLMKQVDLYVAPVSDPAGPIADANLQLTNLTGHPALVLPNGLTRRGTPLGISFIGRLYGEAELLAVAKAYQERRRSIGNTQSCRDETPERANFAPFRDARRFSVRTGRGPVERVDRQRRVMASSA